MSSKKNGHNKKPPLPLIHLDKLLKPKRTERSLSTASNTEPVMDGITTSSGIELPFELNDPSSDPIFLTQGDEANSKHAANTTSQAPSVSEDTIKRSISASGGATAANEEQNSSGEDMDISPEEDDSSTSSTESEDSSVDIPMPRKRPAAHSKTSELSESQGVSSLVSQSEKAAREKTSTVASASEQTAPLHDKAQQETKESNKRSKDVNAVSGETASQAKPREREGSASHSEKQQQPSKKVTEKPRNEEQQPRRSSNDGPPKKRLRTEKGEASSKANVENKENSSSQLLPWPTLPMGETPRPRLDEEEQRLFDKIENMILDDEWAELKEKIESDILNAEEKDLMKRIDLSITAAEEALTPGGRVLYNAEVLEDGSLKEEYATLTKDPFLPEEKSVRKRSRDESRDTSKGLGSRVFDVEDITAEVTRKSRLPKYAENLDERLLTRQVLKANVVAPIMREETRFARPRKLAVRLDDDPDDPFSVVLHCQGHPDLVKLVEANVTLLIRAAQPPPVEHGGQDADDEDAMDTNDPAREHRTQSEKQQRGYSSYQSFLQTYKDVQDIEYKGSGINGNQVKKLMWGRHKDKFGQNCGEDCPCPRDLPYLTGTVVDSFISDAIRKDPTWKNRLRSPVGFVDSFCKKFYKKLKEEHPDETPKQLLARLVLMWKKHEKVRRFGTTCSKECPCREGWDQIFRRGRLFNHEIVEEEKPNAKKTSATMKIPRRIPSNERTSSVVSSTTSGSVAGASVGRIPRRLSNDHARDNAPQSQLLSTLKPPNVKGKPDAERIPRRRASTEPESGTMAGAPKAAMATKKAAMASRSSPKNYEIIFQPGEAMGFFVETTKGSPTCRITSLSDSATRREPKLRVGAVVKNVTHGKGHVQPVRTYMDLKQHYERAKKSGKPIRVRFTNPEASLLAATPRDGEWTVAGDWVGSTSNGWAGGARCVNAKDSRAMQSHPRHSQETRITESIHPPPQQAKGSAVAKKQLLPPRPTMQTLNTMRPARHRETKPTFSILRGPVDRSEKATADAFKEGTSMFKAIAGSGPTTKCKFSEKFEKRFYDPKAVSFQMKREVSSDQTPGGTSSSANPVVGMPAEPTKVLGTKDLIDAIKHKAYRDVIAVLQSGVSPTARDDLQKSPKDYVKERLEGLKFEQNLDPENSNLAAQRKDFELKRKVLSIFIDAIATIDKARFNKKWERFAVNIARIKDVCLSVRGAEHEGSQVLECRTDIKDEEMRPLPLIPIEGTIMHDWRGDPSNRGYSFNYNPHLTDPSRSNAVVSLYKGDRKEDAKSPILLGETIVPLSRISTAVAEGDKIETQLPQNEYITSCEIMISAKKLEADEVRKSKAAEATARLRDVIAWIAQFNNETKVDASDMGALSGQITAPNCGISLLHAAIYLDEPDLVMQLMNLGANPSARSDVGSARMLAENLLGERDKDQKSLEVLNIVRGQSSNDRREICDGVNGDSMDTEDDLQDDTTNPANDTSILAVAGAEQASQAETVDRTAASATAPGTPPSTKLAESIVDASQTSQAASMTSIAGSESSFGGTAPTLQPAERSGYASLAAPEASDRAQSVPLPVFDFWIKPTEEKCHFFGNNKQPCKRGSNCWYLHISPLVGQTLDAEQFTLDDAQLLNPNNIIRKSLRNEEGRILYTAAYRDPNHKDIRLYLAEAGPAVGKSKGVSWYSTEPEAIYQLERVVAFHRASDGRSTYGPQSSRPKRPRDDRNDTRQPIDDRGIYGPQSSRAKRPRDDRNDSHDAHQSSGASKRSRHKRNGGPQSGGSLYKRILKQSNLSLVHSQIFGVPVRRVDWVVRSKGKGQVTATLVCPMDRSKLYQPSQEGGGQWLDGAYWFKSEKEAKASAFHSLLQSCVKYGLVNADCTETNKGARISL